MKTIYSRNAANASQQKLENNSRSSILIKTNSNNASTVLKCTNDESTAKEGAQSES